MRWHGSSPPGLEKELGKPVNVVNRTGGGGVVGHTEMINARPDGYTIGIATAEVTTYYWANTAPYTYDKLTPIALVNFDNVAFFVAESNPWKTLGEALAAIKKDPAGTYKMSGMPVGAAYHLAFSRLLQTEGIDAKAVPVVPNQGAAQGFQELVSGGVQILPSSLPEGRAMVEAKRAKVLAVLAAERLSAFADVPTVKEAIGRDVVGGTWRGVAGPAGLPEEVTTRLIAAVEKVVNGPEFKKFMNDRGFGYRLGEGWGVRCLPRRAAQEQWRGHERAGPAPAPITLQPDNGPPRRSGAGAAAVDASCCSSIFPEPYSLRGYLS